jgi:GNAT superfamily N-acetyltransferase
MSAIEWSTDCNPELVFQLLENQPEKRILWKWQYEMNPCLSSSHPPFLMLVDAGTLVAFCGLMPVRLEFDDRRLNGHWSLDLYVGAPYRRQGLGHRLYAEVERLEDIALGFGTSDMAYPLKMKRSWAAGKQIEEYFFQKKITDFKSLIKCSFQLFKRLANHSSLSHPDWIVRITDSLNADEVDELWNRVHRQYRRLVVRDSRYLIWKYQQHPAGCYRFILLYNALKELQAVVVFRDNKYQARLVDYLGPAKALTMKRHLVRILHGQCVDAASLSCATSCPDWQLALAQEGYMRYKKRPRFTAYIRDMQSTEAADHWFVMTGDSDGDSIDAIRCAPKTDFPK